MSVTIPVTPAVADKMAGHYEEMLVQSIARCWQAEGIHGLLPPGSLAFGLSRNSTEVVLDMLDGSPSQAAVAGAVVGILPMVDRVTNAERSTGVGAMDSTGGSGSAASGPAERMSVTNLDHLTTDQREQT